MQNENGAAGAAPTPDEAREWLKKHLARAPERGPSWCREVLNIYRAGRTAVAEQAEERVP